MNSSRTTAARRHAAVLKLGLLWLVGIKDPFLHSNQSVNKAHRTLVSPCSSLISLPLTEHRMKFSLLQLLVVGAGLGEFFLLRHFAFLFILNPMGKPTDILSFFHPQPYSKPAPPPSASSSSPTIRRFPLINPTPDSAMPSPSSTKALRSPSLKTVVVLAWA